MRSWTRAMFVYGMTWLALVIFVKLSFAVLTGYFYALSDREVPRFEARVQELQARAGKDPEVLEQGLFELMRPVIETQDWTSIRILISLLVFPPIGFLAGFLSGDPRWAGGLPVLALVPPDAANPAVMPFPHVPMAGLTEQIMVFGLQIAIVYACAWMGAVRYWRRRLGGPDEEETPR